MAGRYPPPVVVACGECGGTFELSDRNVRAWRQRGQAPRCRRCRYPNAGKREPTEKDRRYWVDRLGLDEALELSRLLWPAP